MYDTNLPYILVEKFCYNGRESILCLFYLAQCLLHFPIQHVTQLWFVDLKMYLFNILCPFTPAHECLEHRRCLIDIFEQTKIHKLIDLSIFSIKQNFQVGNGHTEIIETAQKRREMRELTQLPQMNTSLQEEIDLISRLKNQFISEVHSFFLLMC